MVFHEIAEWWREKSPRIRRAAPLAPLAVVALTGAACEDDQIRQFMCEIRQATQEGAPSEQFAEQAIEDSIVRGDITGYEAAKTVYWSSPGYQGGGHEYVTDVALTYNLGSVERYFSLEPRLGGGFNVCAIPEEGTVAVESEHSAYYHQGAEPSRAGVITVDDEGRGFTRLTYELPGGLYARDVQVGATRTYGRSGILVPPPIPPPRDF